MIGDDIKYISLLVVIMAIIKTLFVLNQDLRRVISKKELILNEKVSSLDNNDTPKIFFTFLSMLIISRLIIYLVGYMGTVIFHGNNLDILTSFKSMWIRWDAPHFLSIAQYGYKNMGEERYLIVFYPLYPLMIRIFYYVVRDYFWSGIFISNVSLLITCFYFYKLLRIDFSHVIAFNSIKYLLIFPFSFFLALTFTDSLFLALSILTLYNLRLKNWFYASLFGLLATLTRSFGILLVVPAVIEYLQESKLIQNLKMRNMSDLFLDVRNISSFLLIPSGIGLYIYLNKAITGNPFMFTIYLREHWGVTSVLFCEVFKLIYTKIILDTLIMKLCIWVPGFILTIIVICSIFYSFNKIRISYICYSLSYLILACSHSWPLSLHRYLMCNFLIYIVFALISKNRKIDFILTFTSIVLLCFYTIVFTYGSYVM